MGGEQKLSGPDLVKGVPLAEIGEEPLLGHARGEAVLLARSGDEVFAVGAVCTHYSGPLAEGLVVGETVRCPWHHACYDLRTGAPNAPALNPIACYEVVREGNLVRVGEKRAIGKPKPIPEPKRIVILGGGAAGHAAAEMLRRLGYDGTISVLSADDAPPVDRPNLSKDYLAGTAPEEWIPLRPTEFFAEQRIELVLNARATTIKKGEVAIEGGRTFAFDRLLIATGAAPLRLDIQGAERPNVHTLRTLADSRAIISRAKAGARAVVMGASFIGLEVAASLRARDVAVHVVAPERVPLHRVMGDEVGAYIQKLHESHGVVFHLGTHATAIDEKGVTLAGGDRLAADFVIMGVGVRPVTELAEKAGIAVDRGIVVNEYLETNLPGVFAAGDVARYPDPRTGDPIRVEHWVVAQHQGQTAARNMLGLGQKFTAVPFFWSQHYDVGINYVGHAERWDRIELDGKPEDKDCAVRFVVGDETVALATIYRDRASLEFEAAIE
jgi:NADPH-dependent 2,4-dienoyl-CoA reductase/sulfur reductase-like enzyme/nitrite reductase/ring-hydroxylating ferredoxin subunit